MLIDIQTFNFQLVILPIVFNIIFTLDAGVKYAHNVSNTTATLSILRDIAQPWRFFYASQSHSEQLAQDNHDA